MPPTYAEQRGFRNAAAISVRVPGASRGARLVVDPRPTLHHGLGCLLSAAPARVAVRQPVVLVAARVAVHRARSRRVVRAPDDGRHHHSTCSSSCSSVTAQVRVAGRSARGPQARGEHVDDDAVVRALGPVRRTARAAADVVRSGLQRRTIETARADVVLPASARR